MGHGSAFECEFYSVIKNIYLILCLKFCFNMVFVEDTSSVEMQ